MKAYQELSWHITQFKETGMRVWLAGIVQFYNLAKEEKIEDPSEDEIRKYVLEGAKEILLEHKEFLEKWNIPIPNFE